jgi:very-short-patch-repair endonuclease
VLIDKFYIIKKSSNYNYYENLGYKIKNGYYHVKSEDISKGTDIKVEVICDICGNKKEILLKAYYKNISNYNTYCCSNKCAYKVKNEPTNLKKYGEKHHLKIPEILEKLKQTNINKYGSEWFNQSNHYTYNLETKKLEYNKMLDVCESKYGNKYYFKTEHFKDNLDKRTSKYQETMKNKKYTKYDNLIEINNQKYLFFCEKCNSTFEISRTLLKNREKYNNEICTYCNPIGKQFSNKEKKISELLQKKYDREVILNSRKIIKPYELDIYLPDLKLAIEFNGIFWHSKYKKDINFHKQKSDMCLKNGIYLLHIWEDEFNNINSIFDFIFSTSDKYKLINNKIYLNDNFVSNIIENENHIKIDGVFKYNLNHLLKIYKKDIIFDRDKDMISKLYDCEYLPPKIIKENIYDSGSVYLEYSNK